MITVFQFVRVFLPADIFLVSFNKLQLTVNELGNFENGKFLESHRNISSAVESLNKPHLHQLRARMQCFKLR